VSRSVARRIDHVGIIVHDVEAAATYWVEALGFHRTEAVDVLEGSIRLAYLDVGDSTVQLVEPRRSGPLADYLERNGEGLHHICFLVDDIHAALGELGEEPRFPPYPGGRGAKVCFITTTPCGVLVELTEPAESAIAEGVSAGDDAASAMNKDSANRSRPLKDQIVGS
jgi:methylmalonyl-CoA/ethylmalonyl-CoA epimerase